jgi:hypothetical protein
MYFATAWNRRLASSHDPRANIFGVAVEAAFARDAELTGRYHELNNSKWDGMMSQVHMNYVIWNDPTEQTMPTIIHVAGDVPEKMRNAQAVFMEGEDDSRSITLQAKAFDRAVDASGLAWTVIPDHGQSGAALVALPQGRLSTVPPAAPSVEYDVSIPSNRGLDVRLHLSPTLDTTGSGGIRIGVSFDDGPVKTLTSALEPTPGGAATPEQRSWYDAVIDNGTTLSAHFDALEVGDHTLKVWRLDDNIVLESIELVPQ